MPEHTKGPWTVATKGRQGNILAQFSKDHPDGGFWAEIAEVLEVDLTGEGRKANAALIASAPALEETLSLLLRTVWDTLRHGLTDSQYKALEEVGKQAADVLKQARGEG